VAHDPATLIITRLRPARQLCDFCGTPGPAWVYPCNSFTRNAMGDDRTVVNMTGCWFACETCHRHIDADQWVALLDHSMERHGTALTTAHHLAVLRSELAACWLQFCHHRTARATRIFPT
jgi:hypothetical protein